MNVQSQSGRGLSGLIGGVAGLAVAGAVAYAAYQVFPVYMAYFKFKDAIQEAAQTSQGKSEHQVMAQVLEKAAELQLPVTEPQISFRRDSQRAFLGVEYETELNLLPKYTVRWKFTPQADVFLYKPPER